MGFVVRPHASLFFAGLLTLTLVFGCAPKFNFKSSVGVMSENGLAYGPATQLVFTREPSSETASGSEIPIQVTIEDAEGRVVTGGPDSAAQISLTLTSGSGPLNGTTTVTSANGVAEFVYQGVNIATLGSGDVVTATKADMTGSGGVGSLSNTTSSFDIITNNSWYGSSATAEWMTTGGVSGAGTGDGMFNTPNGVFVDSSGNLYVADTQNARVMSFNSSGVYQGWVGFVGAVPTGGAAGCTTATSGKVTPGWCTGGSGGTFTPTEVWGDGTYLYVSTGYYGGEVFRFNASTGVYGGWTGLYGGNSGVMSDTYTTGCNALNGSVTPVVTPGWCVGGETSPESGAFNGAFNQPTGISGDGTYLYVGDESSKVQRIDASTGAAAGWIGNLGTVGGRGCGTSTGSFVGSWCTDATATPQGSGVGDGSLKAANGAGPIGTYYYGGSLYVSDSGNSVIEQYIASTGAFVGWTGTVGPTHPTGGATGCTSATWGYPTPGWCTGGNSSGNFTNDGFWGPAAITGDGTYLYVVDDNNLRVLKYQMSNGTFVGWTGRIGTADSGSCGSAGSFTGGWCDLSGTTAEAGHGDGMLGQVLNQNLYGGVAGLGGIAFGSGALWITDAGNNRVSQYDPGTGAFNGWIGADASAVSGWQTSGLSAGAWDDNSFGQLVSGAYSNGSNLYVADDNRIKNYQLSTGAPTYLGWTGQVLDTPTGGASGCTATASGSVTPGWCTGGDAQDNGSDYSLGGILTENYVGDHLTLDGNYVYMVDGTQRVSRYDMNGAFEGWIGEIGTTPTGGDPGCTSASPGTFTPGWCVGGGYESGTGDGAFSGRIYAIYNDGTYLYAGDYDGGRIEKYIAATGQFVGWIGKILTSPTGGVAGCAGGAVGSITPGWCTGGTADNTSTVNGDGSLPACLGITGDGTYIYTSGAFQSTINRYNAATGAFEGWIGVIGSDGGTCTAGAGNFTGGWCSGGTGDYSGGPGKGGSLGASLWTDGFYLYAFNGNGGARLISKYILGTGAFVGWKGAIQGSPTGGDPGCSGATKNTFTPGWCTGGSPAALEYDVTGAFSNYYSISDQLTGAGSFLYVPDSGNSRIDRIGK